MKQGVIAFLFLLAVISRAEDFSAQVCIIGAGISGVTTAAQLEANGHTDYVIIEARDQAGGRMQKTNFGGRVVEAGANWISGAGGDNPLIPMRDALNIQGNVTNWDYVVVYNESGYVPEDDVPWDEFYESMDHMHDLSVSKQNEEDSCPRNDINIRTGLSIGDWNPKGDPVKNAIEYFEYDWEFAEPPEVTSLLWTTPSPTFEWSEDDFMVIDDRGYQVIVTDYIGATVPAERYHFNRQADIIDWGAGDGKVRIRAAHVNGAEMGVGVESPDYSFVYSRDSVQNAKKREKKQEMQFDFFECDYVVSTVSVGVLENDDLVWVPALPEWKQEAIHFFQMGHMVRIYMVFNDPEAMQFWLDIEDPEVQGLEDIEVWAYGDDHRGFYPMWMNLNISKVYPHSGLVAVTITGEETYRVTGITDPEQVREELHDVLVTMFSPFGTVVPYPDDIYFPKLNTNPLFRGAFSNWPVGVDRFSHNALKNPVGGNIVFSGEHTNELYFGYVHGGYISGLDAADAVMQALDGGSLPEYDTSYSAGSRNCVAFVSFVFISIMLLAL